MERLRAEGITHIINTVEHNCMVTGSNNNIFFLFFAIFTLFFTFFFYFFFYLFFFLFLLFFILFYFLFYFFYFLFTLQVLIYTEKISNITVSSRKTTNDTL